jgi:predicted tellurium resistance membrane protein TerC
MSLDNIAATAAVAEGNAVLILFGLCLSIPAVMFGSVLVVKIFEGWPILRLSGAVLLGWVAGQIAGEDILARPWMTREAPALPALLPALCACYVFLVGHSPTVSRCRQGGLEIDSIGDDAGEPIHAPPRQAMDQTDNPLDSTASIPANER